MLKIINKIPDTNFIAGVILAENVKISPSPPDFRTMIENELEEIKTGKKTMSTKVKEAIRNLLRKGGFKPAGRNKPASEYLYQRAIEDAFPFINNCVDINNFVSLKTCLPISMLDANVLGSVLSFRYGLKGESYVFNTAGQIIDLEGLCCLCKEAGGGASHPLGNPIKDSMEGKLKEGSSSIILAIYSSKEVTSIGDMQSHLKLSGMLLEKIAQGKVVEEIVVLKNNLSGFSCPFTIS